MTILFLHSCLDNKYDVIGLFKAADRVKSVVVREVVAAGAVEAHLPRLRGEGAVRVVGEVGGDLQPGHQLSPPGQPGQQGVVLRRRCCEGYLIDTKAEVTTSLSY